MHPAPPPPNPGGALSKTQPGETKIRAEVYHMEHTSVALPEEVWVQIPKAHKLREWRKGEQRTSKEKPMLLLGRQLLAS